MTVLARFDRFQVVLATIQPLKMIFDGPSVQKSVVNDRFLKSTSLIFCSLPTFSFSGKKNTIFKFQSGFQIYSHADVDKT